MSKKPNKPYWEMNAEELRQATREFDREFIGDTFRPLTPTQRERWEQIRRGLQRSKRDQAQIVSLRLEKTVLTKVDRLAKKLRTSREQVFARGVDALAASAASKPGRRQRRRAA